MSAEQETVCEICGQPDDTCDARSVVVIVTSRGQEFVRHPRCHILDLLERA